MNFQTLTGEGASHALDSSDFINLWEELLKSCVWSTAFQRPDFARIWFKNYSHTYSPVIYYSTDSTGALTHLLCLGLHNTSLVLTPCGAQQAEYHAWLGVDDDFRDFLLYVTSSARKMTKQSTLIFKFLPPYLASLVQRNSAGLAQISRPEVRPIMRFDAVPPPWSSLSKKSNKSKISRLKREGEIQLSLMGGSRDFADVETILRQIAVDYDFRQGAVNNSMPFAQDKSKFQFHQDLIQHTDCFEVLGLTVGGRIVAAILGVSSEHNFGVCIFSHSAVLAKHSPGKLLMSMGSQLLADRGYQAIDLTPGGEWKNRFANSQETVTECSIFFSRGPYYSRLAREQLLICTKQILSWLGVDYRLRLRQARKLTLAGFRKSFRQGAGGSATLVYQLQVIESNESVPAYGGQKLSRNSIKDLLCYRAADVDQGQAKFLAASLRRLEQGETVCSYVHEERLAFCVWLTTPMEIVRFPDSSAEYQLPLPGVLLHDFHLLANSNDKANYLNGMRLLVAEITAADTGQCIYASSPADDHQTRTLIEELGFEYLETISTDSG